MGSENSTRRGFFQASVATGMIASTVLSASEAEQCGAAGAKVCYAELLPDEFRSRLAKQPLAYVPLGTIEWHGEHLPLGADAIQSETLMAECARRYGGIVMPPIYLGPDRAKPADDGSMLFGMDYAMTTKPHRRLEGSAYWVPQGLHLQMVDAILDQLKRAGFRAVFADGHGPSRTSWVENMAEREARYGMRLLGVTKDIAKEWKSQIDHAARNETSLMLHYRPDLVDLSRLPSSKDEKPQGVGGDDPRDATAEHGAECMEASVKLVGELLAKAGLL